MRNHYKIVPPLNDNYPIANISCNWHVLCNQLLEQWNALTKPELEATGKNRRNIATLIEDKYGIPARMAENYLRNFERTLPLFAIV